MSGLCLASSVSGFEDVVFSGVDSESVGCLLLLSPCPSDCVSKMIITC